jgi:UDPglucose--hexose-1-phosphate uridylyltransferase
MGTWKSMSELRWHPLLEQWVVVTAHRQDRPQMPEDWCPFCPRALGNYDVCLYPNDFPAFSFDDPDAPGACDVVLYSPEHSRRPSELPVEQWEKIVALWTRRFVELSADPRVKNVTIFENTGEAVGVTMPHPHGQIYAMPFVPSRVQQELDSRGDYGKVLEEELRGPRVVVENESFVAFAPYFARFPYETQIYPRRDFRTLAEMSAEEAKDLASIISWMRKKYDALFGFMMPLMMLLHQFKRFYVEFLPLQRGAAKLKYLAAIESGTQTFLNDVIPEQAAEALRKAG